jgi:cyclopropane-fatty-acyl-phospholipid synthase
MGASHSNGNGRRTLRTRPLRAALARALPERPFAIRFWDGATVPATEPDAPTFEVRSPQAISHVLRSPGELGLGRAYVLGLLDVDDLDRAADIVDRWVEPEIDARLWARLVLGALVAADFRHVPRRPDLELILSGAAHSPERDAQAVRYHYDVPSEFFSLFLDESMTYSCGIFSRGATTLEEAQATKLELVCSKLALQPGQRVLDVGCGWGSFAVHAAQRHGVSVTGITLSEPQAEIARERASAAGVADRVQFRVMDYRRLAADGERFDAIASIGMVEHVGENQIDEYAEILAALLPRGGRLLNHGIAYLTQDGEESAGPFSERYVWPDAAPLRPSRVLGALERAGFITRHVEEFQLDYAETLRHWSERLDAHADRALELAGAQRLRVWRLYLRAARLGFETGFTSVYQVRAERT